MSKEIFLDLNKRNDKEVIQKAIDELVLDGGGKLIIPSGKWLSGPIHLYSNIHLHFEDEAELTFSEKFEDYLPVVLTRWEGMECYNYSPLIYACGCNNIKITGKGILKGNGHYWWHWKKLQQTAATELCYAESKGIAVEKRIYGTEEAALRPSFIQPFNCKNVEIEGITLIDGPQWMIHPVYCKDVVIKNVTVLSKGHNTDGLNPDSCENVFIENCKFNTGDDCIAINSGMNEDGMRVNKPCKNIKINNCIMEGGHGAVVIGSGMSGGVSNVEITNCKISGTNQGIRIKSMRGRGGYIRDIKFNNIEMDSLEQAIEINMYYKYTTVVPKTQLPPICENISIENIKGKNCKLAVEIIGLPESKIKNIQLKNIEISGEKSALIEDCTGLKMDNVKL